LFSALAAYGQAGGVCPGAVNQALAQLGQNCAGMSRNSACYGFNNVAAQFNVPVPSNFFTVTNDRADLLTINSLRTGQLDLVKNEWGVSLLNVQANLPDALPGQGVVFVLLGGAQIEDAVPKNQAVIPSTSVQVSVTAESPVRSAPDTGAWKASTQFDTAPAGVSLSADAIDPTGGWIRVIYNGKPGWIAKSSVSEDVSSLTVVGPESKTPMQAFFFRTGIGGVTCDEVPSLLAVQGPHNVAVDIQADGVDVRITSTIILQTLPPGPNPTTFQLSVVAGTAILYPDTPQQIIVPAGFTISIPLAPDGQSVVGNWSPIRLLTPAELAQFSLLDQISGGILNYQLQVPFLITPSGVGGSGTQLTFPDPSALESVRAACASGQLAPAVCAVFGL
jgi:hypothetical protein